MIFVQKIAVHIMTTVHLFNCTLRVLVAYVPYYMSISQSKKRRSETLQVNVQTTSKTKTGTTYYECTVRLTVLFLLCYRIISWWSAEKCMDARVYYVQHVMCICCLECIHSIGHAWSGNLKLKTVSSGNISPTGIASREDADNTEAGVSSAKGEPVSIYKHPSQTIVAYSLPLTTTMKTLVSASTYSYIGTVWTRQVTSWTETWYKCGDARVVESRYN